MNFRTTLAAALLALTGFSGRAAAQCFTPDGLDGPLPPTCQPANLTSTDFAVSQRAVGICWRQCGVDATAAYKATWSKMIPSVNTAGTVDCGWFTTRVQLSQSTLSWIGTLNAHYSRTWFEGNPAAPLQVWRYLVNGDLRPTSTTAGPCALPPCAAPNGMKVHFSGYIDYAIDCNSGQRFDAWMITHGCDSVDHAVGYPRAGAFHPDRYYTFVGPAANFVVGAAPSIEVGLANQESVRRWDRIPGTTIGASCQHDEPLAFAAFNPFAQTCLCTAGAPQWYEADLSGAAVGGTTFNTLAGSADYKSVAIGRWTNPGVFPGVEEVRWTTSDLVWTEGCTTLTTFEPFYGVTTSGGFPAWQIDTTGLVTPLAPMFIDQSSSRQMPFNTPVRNIPSRSYHILNLNL